MMGASEKSAATWHPGAGPDEALVEMARQVLDDETLTRTGRSIGDLASEHVARAVLAALAPEFARVRREAAVEALRAAADGLIGGIADRLATYRDGAGAEHAETARLAIHGSAAYVRAYAAEVESGAHPSGDPS